MSGRPDSTCKICGGSGMIPMEPNPPHPLSYKRCVCVLRGDILSNVERGMRGLGAAKVVKDSPLRQYVDSNLWVRAPDAVFKAHLRHVAVRRPPTWNFRVISDAELVTAWLSSIALKGMDILDADAYTVSTKHLTIPDLALPPDLVIVRTGIKAARNEASPEVLLEALHTRLHEGKPTWVWDQPIHQLKAGHLCWSNKVGSLLEKWDFMENLDKPVASATSADVPTSSDSTASKSRGHRRQGTGNRKTMPGRGGNQ